MPCSTLPLAHLLACNTQINQQGSMQSPTEREEKREKQAKSNRGAPTMGPPRDGILPPAIACHHQRGGEGEHGPRHVKAADHLAVNTDA